MSDQIKISEDAVQKLAKILKETDLSEIEYKTEKVKIRVARNIVIEKNMPVTQGVSQTADVKHQEADQSKKIDSKQHPGAVKSPMVGTVYLSPEPGAEPFIKKGDMVKKGQTLLIVEAMKVMNPIKASKPGKVIEICVEDAAPVEFNEPLVVIE